MQKHGLVGWDFGFNKRHRAIGLCRPSVKRIELSIYGMNMSREDIVDTLLHEIAHALTPGAHHGIRWKQKAVEIGCIPSRTLSKEASALIVKAPKRYEIYCDNGCFTPIKRQKNPTRLTRNKICKACKGSLHARRI